MDGFSSSHFDIPAPLPVRRLRRTVTMDLPDGPFARAICSGFDPNEILGHLLFQSDAPLKDHLLILTRGYRLVVASMDDYLSGNPSIVYGYELPAFNSDLGTRLRDFTPTAIAQQRSYPYHIFVRSRRKIT